MGRHLNWGWSSWLWPLRYCRWTGQLDRNLEVFSKAARKWLKSSNWGDICPSKYFMTHFWQVGVESAMKIVPGIPGKWLWEVAPPSWAIRALSWDAGAVPIMSLCCPPVTEHWVGWGHPQGSEWRAFRALGRAGAGIQMLHIRREPCSRSPPPAVSDSEWCLSQSDPAVCLVKNG